MTKVDFPEPAIPSKNFMDSNLFTEVQMKDYGERCRSAAIEDAASYIESADMNSLSGDSYLQIYTSKLLAGLAKIIRQRK